MRRRSARGDSGLADCPESTAAAEGAPAIYIQQFD
jgi:hypothetical protein